MKLNRTQQEAEEFIKSNLKSFGGSMTQVQVGKELGVSGPRISQIASGMRPKVKIIPSPQPEPAEASEAV